MDAYQTKQMFCGAAVAAFLILPSLSPGHAAPTAPQAMLVSDSGGWVTSPQKSFAVRSVKVDDLVGTVAVSVKPDGPVMLDISGLKSRVDGLDVAAEGGSLRVEGRRVNSVWDWRNWFDFSGDNKPDPKNLMVKLTVPKGTELSIHGLVGDAVIGDTMGPLNFEAAVSNAKIGRVGAAKLSLAGSGRIEAVEIDGPLKLEIAGAGKVHVGKSKAVKADIAGAGDAQLGHIDGGLRLSIAGSGDVAAASVNGPVHVSIAGSGSVKIANGEANPLHVSIMGSGNIDFGGMAVDPDISALGSGSVRLKAYRGHLSGNARGIVKVNGQSVKGSGGDDDDDSD